ncbi:MATE family efflux transporter, partial [Intestinimonas butyriciproducens]
MPKQHQAVDMTQGDPLGLLVRFSLPLLAGNAFQQLYNMVDSWVVGNFVGTTALAAVGIGFPVIYLLSSLFMGLSIGGSVVIAQFMGAGDREAVRRSVNTVYGAVMVSVVPLTLFGVLIAGPILHLIRVPADVYDQAHVYLQVIFAGIIGSLGYNINAGILQGLGDSKTPLLFLATACVVNIVLDLVFVLVFDWGVFGVAFATIIAQLCSWIFGVCYVNRKYDFIAIRPLHISVDNVLLKRVLKLGVPSGIQQCQFSVAILVLQALINGFGAEFAAGFSAANKVDTFAFMPVDSFCLAVTTYVGQNVGAGRLDRVREGVRKAILLCVGVCLVMSVL